MTNAGVVAGWEQGLQGTSVAAADWFKKDATQAVFACLNQEGFEARAVGGAVRNTLLGRAVDEVDFATTAPPKDIMRLARGAGLKAIPTGIEHGTVTLVVQGTPFEATTLRKDIKTHGRHATVAFGSDWTEDAKRRDFTMNALYADARGRVFDPLGGLSDLLAGRVRFIGDADRRIREDHLRILRFFRFSAEYASAAFDAEGIAASIRGRAGLEVLSRERVRQEWLQILVARRAIDAVRILEESGLLLPILGGVPRRLRFEAVCAREDALGRAPDALYRLAALAVFVAEDAARLVARLRLSNNEAAILEGLARGHAAGGKAGLYRLGARIFAGRILLQWADSGASAADEAFRQAIALAQDWTPPAFPLSGADLLARGYSPGPDLGARLRALEEAWIESDFSLSKEALLERLGRA